MKDARRALMAKIHIAKKDLGLDEDTYRAVLARHGAPGDRPSSAQMTVAQLEAAVRELQAKGWTPKKPGAGRRPRPPRNRAEQITKIEALLADKAKRQGRPVPWAYADAIAKRVCRVDKVDWCDTDQLRRVIAALEYDRRRG